ncbi:MAG: hypothetical protein ACP5QB_13750, partial [Thiomonas sp.]
LIVTTKGGFLDRTTIATCPLGGPLGTPVANLAAFTVLRADLLRSAFTRFAFGGLAVLLATLLASAAFLAWMVLGFSRRLAGVEAALTADQPGALALTGEVELDRLITALNAATTRLDAARARIAESERLAALGRMAAGHAAYFKANVAQFDRSLQPWYAAIAAFKAKHDGTPVAETEPVGDYMLQAVGADIKTP